MKWDQARQGGNGISTPLVGQSKIELGLRGEKLKSPGTLLLPEGGHPATAVRSK